MNALEMVSPDARAADLDARQEAVALLLRELDCEGLLVTEAANVAWLTAGASGYSPGAPVESPGVYYSAQQRWVLCSSLDTQALFDEQLDGLGFQLKEWPWARGRETLLCDLTCGRTVATDTARPGCTEVGERLATARLSLGERERQLLVRLGCALAHALEATGRNLQRGESERQIAGQLAHRLVQHGIDPVQLRVAADERDRRLPRHGNGSTPVTRTCQLEASARQGGLHLWANRTVTFGEPSMIFRHEFDTACRLSAAYLAASKPGLLPAEVLAAGVPILQRADCEYADRLQPFGLLCGYQSCERLLHVDSPLPLPGRVTLAWQPRIGAAVSGDSYFLSDETVTLLTPCDGWPIKRFRTQGQDFDRPDLLVRTD